jgi:toxin ParE1/3/4
MRIRWTPAAAADLEESNEYLKNKHPNYWQSTVRRLYQEILGLKDLPNRGRVGREEGTRELVFSPLPYIAVYRVRDQTVEVLRIYHGARNI